MRRPISPVHALCFLAGLAVAGCGCPVQRVANNLGELGVVWRDATGSQVISRDATFDFGDVQVGDRAALPVQVRNLGVNSLRLTSVEVESGSAEVGVGTATATSAFELDFRGHVLAAGDQVDFTAAFTPRGPGPFIAQVRLLSTGGRPEDSTALVTLRGNGVRGACDLPSVVDFGKVPVGDALSLPVALRNVLAREAAAFVGPLSGADAPAFAVSPVGQTSVPAGGQIDALFTFTPTERRAYSAQTTLRGAGGCPDVLVTVRGEGADDVLQWMPATLAFGTVAPGVERTARFTVTNLSNVPLVLSGFTSPLSDYRRVVAAGEDATRLVVPGGGVPTSVTIACTPTGLGRRDSTLTFTTPLRRQPMGSVALQCAGGGPRVRVTPSPNLAFGRVGFFPGGSVSARRRLTVQNVGTVPVPPDPTAHLYLGQLGPDGAPGERPWFELTPRNATTSSGEFSVTVPPSYDPTRGLEAVAGRNSLELVVTLTATSPGRKEAELVIYTNDPMEPAVRLTLSADAQVLPPCQLRVTPGALNFGLVTPPLSKELPITLTNLGVASGDVCLLSAVGIEPGSSPAYSLVGGPVAEKELRPGEAWTLTVRVAPPGPVPTSLTPALGHLSFEVSTPATPVVRVPLTTLVGASCLAVTPDPVHFGTVKVGCNSQARTVSVYNVCAANVTVTGLSLAVAGGPPPGTSACPGPGACPEFFITTAPSLPSQGLTLAAGSAPVQVQLRFTPLDVGVETGALALTALQSGQTVTYLTELSGEGDTVGRQTDTFQQLQQPKADILLVIDDSCSMDDKQMNLANNFASFIQYATTTNTDYQVGVITTSQDPQPCLPPLPCLGVAGEGKLVTRGGVGPILTSMTPNLAQAFTTLVRVGTDGDADESGLSTATMALTPPRIANENAGFLRADANLAVVVVSDAGDQSPQPVSYYQNRLINVKGFNRLSMFTFSSIVPMQPTPPPPCSYDSGDPQRYLTVSAATAGVTDDICSSNWSATLQSLGRTAFGFRTVFYLNNTPDLSMGRTLDVRVNGTSVAAADYSYDAAANAVIFTPATAPTAGRQVTVSYFTACF
ncbi:MAG: choice-of-anchor D domain-containing protein [Myxococcaceae bacterium]|nr:choice-of-anchor D domain-containing protein [Myxococcaceae bacterium]